MEQPGALAPLRDDAPGRRAIRRGTPSALSSVAERATAVDALVQDFHAASSRKVQTSMWNTILEALARWGLP